MLVVAVAAGTAGHAAPVRVLGRITDSGSAVIPAATVMVTALGKKLTVVPEPVVDGKVDLTVQAEGPSLTCVIGAKGFEARRLTVEVKGASVDLGTIQLERVRALKVHEPLARQAADGESERVELSVHNESAKTITIRTLRVQATRRRKTDCLDLKSLELAFTLAPTLLAMVPRDADGATDVAMKVKHAELKELKCGQAVLDVSLDYDFPLKPDDWKKLVVVLPKLPLRDGGAPALLALESWDVLVVTLTDGEGRTSTVER